MNQKIRLFWWNEKKLMGRPHENFGDLLGKYLVEKITNKKVVWVHPSKWHFKDLFRPIYVTIGSILAHVNSKCVVWGSGVISRDSSVKKANFLAVRGPQTRAVLLGLGYQVPEVYGDPAILLPKYYQPSVKKTYSLGIVPHYRDYQAVKDIFEGREDVLVIDLLTNDIEATTDLFLQCERMISSSLHGLIVSHAYHIPAIWVPFSNKLFGDGIKFQDYFESVEIENYKPKSALKQFSMDEIQDMFDTYPSLPKKGIIKQLQDGLMSVCPF